MDRKTIDISYRNLNPATISVASKHFKLRSLRCIISIAYRGRPLDKWMGEAFIDPSAPFTVIDDELWKELNVVDCTEKLPNISSGAKTGLVRLNFLNYTLRDEVILSSPVETVAYAKPMKHECMIKLGYAGFLNRMALHASPLEGNCQLEEM